MCACAYAPKLWLRKDNHKGNRSVQAAAAAGRTEHAGAVAARGVAGPGSARAGKRQ